MGEISWQKRLAIVLSAIWLALIGAFSRSESDSLTSFLILGVLPIAFCWGIAWVWSGFRRQRPTAPPAVTELRLDESASRATLYTLVAVVFLVTGVGFFYYAFAKTSVEPAEKIAYLVGFYFWVPILVYVVWKSTFKKRKGMGLLLFAVAFLGVAIYQSHAMLHEEEEARLLLSKAQTMMLKLMNGEMVDRVELSDAGQYSAVLLLSHDFLLKVMNEFQTLNKKIETSGLETMLTPETLSNLPTIIQAIATLESLSAHTDKTESGIMARYDEFPRIIDSADIPYDVKADFKTGAEDGIRRGKATLSEFFKIQRTFIATAIEMLGFMKERQGRLTRQGDQILFESQADADKYNQYLQLIQAIALQESEWHNQQ